MLEIFGITMRTGAACRILVKATDVLSEAWLEILNEGEDVPLTLTQALSESAYASNNEGYLAVEVEVNTESGNCQPIYYFNEYEDLDATLTKEEQQQLLDFALQWIKELPDNEELLLGEVEWLSAIPEEIPWKSNFWEGSYEK